MATPLITHTKISGKAAGTDSTRIYGTHWDAVHTVTGLENVDNTSDANKPISTLTQTALDERPLDVSTIAALKALTVAATTRVFVAGYYAEGDGGGGWFYGATASAATDNGGTIIAPNGGTGRWLRDIPEPGRYSVKWFGAKGDGSTDDYAIIAAMVTALDDQVTVVFPAGQYKVSGTIINLLDKRSMTFIGAANADGQLNNNLAATEIVYTGTAGPLIRLDGTQAIEFRDLALQYSNASYTANAPLINLQTVSGAVVTNFTLFENCNIGGWNTSAKNAILIDAKNSIKTVVRDCYMRNGYAAVVGARSAVQADFCNDMTIEGVLLDKTFTATPFLAGGCNWRFLNLIAEPPRGITAAASLTTISSTPYGTRGIVIDNASFYDGGDNTGSWIDFINATDYGAQGPVEACVITGGYAQCSTAAVGGVLDVGTNGVNGLVFTGMALSRAQNVGFIDGATYITNGNITSNFVNGPGGPGVGKVFVGAEYPVDAGSIFDDNTGGLQVNYLNFATGGTVSAPPITLNDADTGIFSSGANVSFAVNGLSAAVINASGLTVARTGNGVTYDMSRKDALGGSGLVAQFSGNGQDSAAAEVTYARMWGESTSDTAGTHAGKWEFGVAIAGTTTRVVRLLGTILSPVTSGGATLGSSALPWAGVVSNGAITSSSATAGIGYATGAGGTVAQGTSKATGVSLSKTTGTITMDAAALNAGVIVSFVLTNTAIAATDALILNHVSGGTVGSYTLNARAAAGSATIDVRNATAGNLSEAIVIKFIVVKGVNA